MHIFESINVRVPVAVKEQLQEEAKGKFTSMSQLVRDCLVERCQGETDQKATKSDDFSSF